MHFVHNLRFMKIIHFNLQTSSPQRTYFLNFDLKIHVYIHQSLGERGGTFKIDGRVKEQASKSDHAPLSIPHSTIERIV